MATTPVVPEHRQVHFANEGKDVLGDVLKDPNRQAISGDTGTYFDAVQETPPEPPVEAPPAEPPKEATPEPAKPAEPPKPAESAAPPAEPKLLAGKFKTPEALEEGYVNLEKMIHKRVDEGVQAALAKVRPNGHALSDEERETARLNLINEFLTDPQKAEKRIEQHISESLAERQKVEAREAMHWETNKDMAPYKKYIGMNFAELAQANPDADPWAVLEQATTQMREAIGAIRDEGKKEALGIQREVTTPTVVKVNTPPPTEQPAKAPMSEQDSYQAHMAELSANAARVRRSVR